MGLVFINIPLSVTVVHCFYFLFIFLLVIGSSSFLTVESIIRFLISEETEPHQWCNGCLAYFEWYRSWVRVKKRSIKLVFVCSSSDIDRGFESKKEYEVGICLFFDKSTELRRMSKDWLFRNRTKVSEWSDMSTHRRMFPWTNTVKIQRSVLV